MSSDVDITAPVSPVRPRNDLLIVKVHEQEDEKPGALWVPDSQKNRVWTGTVLMVGPGKFSKKGKRIPMEVKPGMRVTFFRENFETATGKATISVLRQLGKGLGMLQERDILWIIED